MKPKMFTHRPIEVTAVQIARPYLDVSNFVHRSRQVKNQAGRFDYFHLVDAVGRTQAHDGDWVLKFSNGAVQILTDEEFRSAYA